MGIARIVSWQVINDFGGRSGAKTPQALEVVSQRRAAQVCSVTTTQHVLRFLSRVAQFPKERNLALTTETYANASPDTVGPKLTRSVLDRDVFLVKEHAGLFKASSNYDVFDPETGEVILECREPKLGWLTRILRFTDYKRMTPFDVHLTTPAGEPVVRVSRGI